MGKEDFKNAGEESCFQKNFWNGWKKWVFISTIVAVVVVVILLCMGGNSAEDELNDALANAQDAINDALDNAVILEDDSMSMAGDQDQIPKIKDALVALLLQMRLCNVDEDMIKEDKIREETQKLGTMALIRVITKRVEELINFKLLNDI